MLYRNEKSASSIAGYAKTSFCILKPRIRSSVILTMHMKILVTGGAGYIGSVVADQLVAAGHHVTVFDNLSGGHRAALPAGIELVEGELADKDRLSYVFQSRSFDAVMHFAAFIEAGESMICPERFFDNNSATALVLLECMLRAGVRRLIFSSTAAIFGNPVSTPILEEDAFSPTNPYGESKLIVERMLTWFHRIHGMRYASLRYFNASGSSCAHRGEAHDPETHLIPRVLKVALRLLPSVQIYGTNYPTSDGTCVRDYIHVSDLANAHLLALLALDRCAQPLIYNLGNGCGFSVREVIEAARKVTGQSIDAIEAPPRAGDPAILVASSEKIRRELDWRPQYTSLEAIIKSAWDWHRTHPNGYAKVDLSHEPKEEPDCTAA
jgi:UDP-glucose 4-epimerase